VYSIRDMESVINSLDVVDIFLIVSQASQ